MTTSILRYLMIEVCTRWKGILLTSETLVALILAGCYWMPVEIGFDPDVLAHTILSGALSYGSIAFGFSVTGLTLSLALSDPEFVKKMALRKSPGSSSNTYADLLFVYSWTAVIHVFLIGWLMISYFVFDSSDEFIGTTMSKFEKG